MIVEGYTFLKAIRTGMDVTVFFQCQRKYQKWYKWQKMKTYFPQKLNFEKRKLKMFSKIIDTHAPGSSHLADSFPFFPSLIPPSFLLSPRKEGIEENCSRMNIQNIMSSHLIPSLLTCLLSARTRAYPGAEEQTVKSAYTLPPPHHLRPKCRRSNDRYLQNKKKNQHQCL